MDAGAVLEDEVELGVLFNHRDDFPPDLLGKHGHLDVLVVLEAVADDGRIVVGHGHHGHELGLGAGFQAEAKRLAELENLFHNLALLVDLDGVDAAIAALVVVLVDGGLEGGMDLAQAVLEDIGKADQDGKVDATEDEGIDQFFQINGAGGILFGANDHVAGIVDREIAFAPTCDIVKVASHLGSPALSGLHHKGAFTAISFQLWGFSSISVSDEKPKGARGNCVALSVHPKRPNQVRLTSAGVCCGQYSRS